MTEPFAGFAIDGVAHVPPYRQICDYVAAQIRRGALPVGTQLPTVRGLAGTLGIANGTAAKAYEELAAAGLIETRGRSGTRIAATPGGAADLAAGAASSFAAQVLPLGLSEAELLDIVRAALRRPPG